MIAELVQRLRGRREVAESAKLESYAEVVRRLAVSPDEEGDERTIEKALAQAGKSPDDLAADVAAAAERLKLEAVIATGPALRAELADADEAVQELERALREVVAELTSKLQAAGAVRGRVQAKLIAVSEAQHRLAERDVPSAAELERRAREGKLRLARAQTQGLLDRLPTFEQAELDRLRDEQRELADVRGSRLLTVEESHRMAAVPAMIERLEWAAPRQAQRSQLARRIEELDRQIEAVQAGA